MPSRAITARLTVASMSGRERLPRFIVVATPPALAERMCRREQPPRFAVVTTQATQRERVCPQTDWVFMRYKLANSKPSAVCPRPLRYTSLSFAGTPALLPYGALAFVRSTPSLGRPCTFFALRCLGVRYEHTPSFAGTPTLPPTSLPRPFDHWIHSLVPRSYQRGFSDLPHSLLGVRPRLSPHPGHDDWNPGQLGFQFLCMQ
jgi:hypothetical protein